MFDAALIRYNFRVLLHHNGWLLTVPLAASQLTVFWTAATDRFIPALPATIVETVSPLLGAFLCAHLMAAEYRSGVGAVLASKPVDIRKVILVRLALALALVWALTGLALLTFFHAMEPYPWLPPLAAGMISTLFLSLLALTFATLFRHPLAGFAVAAVYWAMDLPPGPPMNPYLSLKSLATSFHPPGPFVAYPLTDNWWIAKAVLGVLAIALFVIHNRLIFQLGAPQPPRRGQRILGVATAVIALYLVGGAGVKVGYGFAHRGSLFPSDLAWFRQQFGSYGLIPVSALFGRNFQRYLGTIPNSWRMTQGDEATAEGDTEAHRRDLKLITELAPGSMWAPGALLQIARLEAKDPLTVEQKVAYWRPLIERYPDSPYTVNALQQIARIYAEWPDADAKAREAYQELLKRYPVSEYSPSAYRFLAESDLRHNDLPGAEENVRKWIQTAPVHEAFLAWMLLAEIQKSQGKTADARSSVESAVKAIAAFRAAARDRTLTISEPKRVRVEEEARGVLERAARWK